MKEQNWNELATKEGYHWDSWRRPYVNIGFSGLFTLFDTGEIVACTKYVNSSNRGHYSAVDITLCNSEEIYDHIPDSKLLRTPDDVPVVKAHLTKLADGSTDQQLFAVDKSVREIYFCGGEWGNNLPSVPEDIAKRATLYWARHDCRPVSLPIRVVSPCKLDKEQKAKQQEANLLVEAAASLRGVERRNHIKPANDVYVQVPHDVYDTDRPIVDIVQDMSDDVLAAFKEDGIPTRKTKYVPYLKF